MNPITVFLGAVIDGAGFLALLGLAFAVGNFRSVTAWVRDRWTEFTELPPTTTVDRMVREVEQRERGGLR